VSRLLGGLSPAAFLRGHWQQRPLLVRGAFPGFVAPLSPEGLAGLACREDVESRLVMERGGRRPWEVVHGPQDPKRLRRLPATHWTLLVQGVDRLLPAVAALVRPFGFLPSWRIDDVMVSFAPRHGSVGPHVDSYDVFLLQGLGRRRWTIDTRARPDFRPGLDLRILRRFRPQSSFVLEPGDMLYLPPGVGHHGVALEDGLTFSIGFRAPSGRELLAALLRPEGDDVLYRDPPLVPARWPGEITPAALRGLRRLAALTVDRHFAAGVGELVTEPKTERAASRRPRPDSVADRVRRGAWLVGRPGARVAFLRHDREVLLFAEGRSFRLERRLAFAGPLLGGAFSLSADDLRPHLGVPGFADLVADLIAAGAFALRRRPSSPTPPPTPDAGRPPRGETPPARGSRSRGARR
jgi:50S ribosomal protein L16 3-hydroxylase